MKRFMFILLVLILSVQESSLYSQVVDGTYIDIRNPLKRPVKYPHLRQADVMFAKRVWRYMDLKEKMNHPFAYPLSNQPIEDRQNLFDVIHEATLKQPNEDGYLTAYNAYDGIFEDDEFRVPLTPEQTLELGRTIDTIEYVNEEDELVTIIDTSYLDRSLVVKFKLKEEWIFDKQRSVMEPRIIGLAPVVEMYSESGEFLGFRVLYWIYFPELRHILARENAFNTFNDGEQRSFDELFLKRRFSSYVIKESNVFNRKVQEYATGLDALLESEKIKNEIFIYEHDLWEY